MGISPMGFNSVPATDPRKPESRVPSRPAGDGSAQAKDVRPSQIVTREGDRERDRVGCMTGGSTNAVLHLLAIAHEAGIELDIDDFDRISNPHSAARPT